MRRVARSVIAREQLHELLAGGVDRQANIISALVETVTRLVVQELLEGEQADYLGGRGRYERRGDGQLGSRNGYERGRLRTAEGGIDVAVPQVRGSGEPFQSSLMGFLDALRPLDYQRFTPRQPGAQQGPGRQRPARRLDGRAGTAD
jgi:Transposase, Mutator family